MSLLNLLATALVLSIALGYFTTLLTELLVACSRALANRSAGNRRAGRCNPHRLWSRRPGR